MWSDHLTVAVAGFGQELVEANPSRVAIAHDLRSAAATATRIATENQDAAHEAGVDVLEGRLRGTDGDIWMPHVLLAVRDSSDDNHAELLNTCTGRSAVAVVLTGHGGVDEWASHIEVTPSGSLVTSLLPDTEITALGLPLADAVDMARAIALNRESALDEPTQRSTRDQPWDAFTDAAGALLPEYTAPRASDQPVALDPTTAASSSPLPGPDEAYLAATATTPEDLAELAPAVTVETRAAVEQSDPELDELVAAWHDPDVQLAKLQVLGPVTVTAFGRPPVKQEDFCTEIVATCGSSPTASPPTSSPTISGRARTTPEPTPTRRTWPPECGTGSASIRGRNPSIGREPDEAGCRVIAFGGFSSTGTCSAGYAREVKRAGRRGCPTWWLRSTWFRAPR